MTGLPVPIVEPPELVARTREGDEGAFATLVGTYHPFVFRWAIALAGDEDEADDITQEVFVRVHRKLSSFRGDGPFEGWLYRITRRVALRTRQTTAQQIASTTQDVYVTDPGARVDRQRAIELIQTIAKTLPVRQREVFILCDLEGRTPAEAAAMLDMKDVSVRASLFKARSSIRRSDRVTRVLAEREHNMRMAFGDLQSSVPAAQTAASAVMTSRRRKVAPYYEIGLGIATAATVLYMMMSRIGPAPPPSSRVSETFRLQCLSPEQAAEVLRPHIQATGRISFRANSALGVITVEASREEMVTARSVLDRYDSPAQSQCAVQVTVPKVP